MTGAYLCPPLSGAYLCLRPRKGPLLLVDALHPPNDVVVTTCRSVVWVTGGRGEGRHRKKGSSLLKSETKYLFQGNFCAEEAQVESSVGSAVGESSGQTSEHFWRSAYHLSEAQAPHPVANVNDYRPHPLASDSVSRIIRQDRLGIQVALLLPAQPNTNIVSHTLRPLSRITAPKVQCNHQLHAAPPVLHALARGSLPATAWRQENQPSATG